MKNKNVILGIVSMLFAAGSAFASLATVAPDFIHVKYSGDANFTCTQITPSCSGGSVVCSATVSVNGAAQATPVYDLKTNTTTCSVRLTAPQALGAVAKSRTIIQADAL
jgi:type 1 fimbria pilin